MTALLFPDNTVLVNFALMGREDLFVRLVDGRGGWTVTIAGECHRSAQEPELAGLATIAATLGDPLIPSPAERVDTQILRARLAVAGDPDTKHLGEAEALAILAARSLDAVFVTDDRGARQLAGAIAVGVKTATTTDLLRVAVKAKLLTDDAAWALVELMRARRRATWNAPRTYAEFQLWVGTRTPSR